jgi:hypothetical protein
LAIQQYPADGYDLLAHFTDCRLGCGDGRNGGSLTANPIRRLPLQNHLQPVLRVQSGNPIGPIGD